MSRMPSLPSRNSRNQKVVTVEEICNLDLDLSLFDASRGRPDYEIKKSGDYAGACVLTTERLCPSLF